MRCLALAQAWQDAGGRATFLWAEMPDALVARLKREDIDTVRITETVGSPKDSEVTAGASLRTNATWIVVDGYHFRPEYYERLRAVGLKVLALDDMAHLSRYPVDLLLNQNLSAQRAMYEDRIDAATELLLGPRYSLLRREFHRADHCRSLPVGKSRRVLVSFGGGDEENFTGRILENLIQSQRRDLDVVVLVGAANARATTLQVQADRAPFPCEIRGNVDNVAAVMAWADVAITAAGSTVWELASMRLPALIGAFEDNQLAGLRALAAIPFFRAYPAEELVARDLAADIDALLAQPLAEVNFDAKGAQRVVERMNAIGAAAHPSLTVA